MTSRTPAPALRLQGATLSFGDRTLWSDMSLEIPAGQFVAVLGANGSGKTSMLRVLLGLLPLTAGSAEVAGRPVRRGSTRVGYVPQRVALESGNLIKARDLVRMGLDGHRWGLPLSVGRTGRAARHRVDELLTSVGASAFADMPVGRLSGGELQRVRVAAALAADPDLLLCDEPLAALDLRRQREIADLIDAQRRRTGAAVLFVTHDVNAVLEHVDQVLYLAGGRWRLGPPDEVLTSAGLTELYGAPVDVVRVQDRVIVVSATEGITGHQSHDDHAAHHAAHHGAHDADALDERFGVG
nr:ATP-binding cassette domain-containing protein [Nakamurella leprariae]